MPKPLKDQAARARIATALDKNMLVEAGAGSGKTHEMARRMAAGIARGAYRVEHMAAVTFTRKAAAELRGRFQLALEGELAESAHDAARAERIRTALSSLERFFAGTIHAFCAHLLRERPVEAGVSPGFSELDEVEDERLRRASWRDFRTQARAAGDPVMIELIACGVRPADLDRAFDTVCLYEEVTFPGGAASAPDVEPAWQALRTFWSALERLLPRSIPDQTTCPTQKAAMAFVRQWRIAERRPRHPRLVASLLAHWDFAPAIVQKHWSDSAAEKRRIRDAVAGLHEPFRRDVVTPYLTGWRQYLYRLSVNLLTRARDHAADERRRLNTLNYGDLLQLAARVMRTNSEVREALGAKYRWLFVDEFQDTDPVQAEIILLLAGALGANADWRSMPLRPGALFVVGDPKQSIYRFRRADIDIYSEVRRRLETAADGEVVPLTSNFRSVPALCEWANGVFRGQFPDTPSPYSPAFASLDAARPASGRALPTGVATLTVPEQVDARDVAAIEAERIARYIRAEVAAGRRRYGDFLILTRKKRGIELYAKALEDLRTPVEVSGAGAFGSSAEVQQFALLLQALADPQDGVALTGVLRGPLFGLSDRDLFEYRQAGGWFHLFAEVEVAADTRARAVADAIASLRQMHRWTQMLPMGAALDRILEHTGYLALAATTPDGVEAGDLLHAVDRVRRIVGDGHTLADAVAALEPDAEESSEVESLSLEPARGDTVRLMNLHKAKGLEAAVVFLANPLSAVSPRVDARIIRDGATAQGYFLITRQIGEHGSEIVAEPPNWAVHQAEERRYLEAEETRLLYVAATRARELLVVGRWAKRHGRARPWAVFDSALERAPELELPGALQLPLSDHVDLSDAALAVARDRVSALHDEGRRPSWTAASVTGEHQPVASEPAEPVAATDDPTRVIVARTPSRRADAGAAWGSLIHGLLEHALRHRHASTEDVRRLALWLTVDEPDLRPVIDDAVATVQEVARRELWREARASAECHEEVPFAVTSHDAEGRPIVLHGTIDAVFRTGQGWTVMDYKTDVDGDGGTLEARYRAQLTAYAEAWRRFVAVPVATAIVPARR